MLMSSKFCINYIKFSGIPSGSKSIKTLSRQWWHRFHPHVLYHFWPISSQHMWSSSTLVFEIKRIKPLLLYYEDFMWEKENYKVAWTCDDVTHFETSTVHYMPPYTTYLPVDSTHHVKYSNNIGLEEWLCQLSEVMAFETRPFLYVLFTRSRKWR